MIDTGQDRGEGFISFFRADYYQGYWLWLHRHINYISSTASREFVIVRGCHTASSCIVRHICFKTTKKNMQNNRNWSTNKTTTWICKKRLQASNEKSSLNQTSVSKDVTKGLKQVAGIQCNAPTCTSLLHLVKLHIRVKYECRSAFQWMSVICFSPFCGILTYAVFVQRKSFVRCIHVHVYFQAQPAFKYRSLSVHHSN